MAHYVIKCCLLTAFVSCTLSKLITAEDGITQKKDCPPIKWCDKYVCDASSTICTQCDHYAGAHYMDSAYWLNNNQCIPRCNWLDHWCWPGTCDVNNEYLASTCQCMPGFIKVTPDEMTTKCQITHPPIIETCRLGLEGPDGEVFNSSFSGNTTSCANTRDTWVNVQPAILFFAFDFAFDLPEDPPSPDIRHKYVDSYSFGSVDGDVTHILYPMSGAPPIPLLVLDMPTDAECNYPSFDANNPATGLVSCWTTHEFSHGDVEDGDKLCHSFKSTGSGYVQIRNLVDHSVSDKMLYANTTVDAEKCFLFEFNRPDHCGNLASPCSDDPLDLGPRIQRHPTITAQFSGYFDPEKNGSMRTASGIEKFRILIHSMNVDEDSQSKRETIIKEYNITNPIYDKFTFNLPELGLPMLFAIYLETVDKARNVRQARRFVLYDNISKLALDDLNPLLAISANHETDYVWQSTLNPIIISWNGHFYNDWFRHTNHLLPITSDKHVEGIFEQTNGRLPVSGTKNVDGIVSFKYKFEKICITGNQSAPYSEIAEVTDQEATLTGLSIADGDAVNVEVLATDINGNTITDQLQLFIDSSPPVLQNLWLTTDGKQQQLSFKTNEDLSKMEFKFEAFDIHSGLKTVHWTLGTASHSSVVGNGTLPVEKMDSEDSCAIPEKCACPAIGKCQSSEFMIEMGTLVESAAPEGGDITEYFFWIEATNEASLTSVEEVRIHKDNILM